MDREGSYDVVERASNVAVELHGRTDRLIPGNVEILPRFERPEAEMESRGDGRVRRTLRERDNEQTLVPQQGEGK